MQTSNQEATQSTDTFTLRGTVEWFNGGKGYGFINRDDGGQDVYVHHTGIVAWTKQSQDDTRRLLYPGERVEFDLVAGNQGKPAAKNVRVLNS